MVENEEFWKDGVGITKLPLFCANDQPNKTRKGVNTKMLSAMEVLPTGTMPRILMNAESQIMKRQTGIL